MSTQQSILGGEAACPRCDAQPGEPCRGVDRPTVHGERVAVATGHWDDFVAFYGRPATGGD